MMAIINSFCRPSQIDSVCSIGSLTYSLVQTFWAVAALLAIAGIAFLIARAMR